MEGPLLGSRQGCTMHSAQFNAEAAVLTLSIITVKSIGAVLRTPYRASLHNWRHWLLISPLSWMLLAPAVEQTNCFGVGQMAVGHERLPACSDNLGKARLSASGRAASHLGPEILVSPRSGIAWGRSYSAV